MGDGADTLPWDQDTRGGGAGGSRAGCTATGDAGSSKQRERELPYHVQLIPATGLLHAAPSITRRRDLHRVITGVSTLSAGWEPRGAPSCPGSRFAGGRIARPWAGTDPGSLSGPGRRLSPGRAVAFPPQPSGATGSAEVGLVSSPAPLRRHLPRVPGELRDGGCFPTSTDPRDARPSLHPHPWDPRVRRTRGRGAHGSHRAGLGGDGTRRG